MNKNEQAKRQFLDYFEVAPDDEGRWLAAFENVFNAAHEVSLPHLETLCWLSKLAGWSPDKGQMVGYFRDYPRGHRCIWSAKWHTSRGWLMPDNILPLEFMSLTAEVAEQLDVSPTLFHECHQKLLEAREKYPDFLFYQSPPEREFVAVANPRPGWGISKDEAKRFAGLEVLG